MIKVKIKTELIEKHRKYLINKKLNERLETFKNNKDFFKREYLNKLVDVNRDKKCSDNRFFLEKFSANKRKKLLKQHRNFINYMIREVDDLKYCKEFSNCNNIFLAVPSRLYKKNIEIKKRYKYLYMYLKIQSSISNKRGEKKEVTYASELRRCLGYYEFSNETMNYYYKYELEKIELLKDIDGYKSKLMLTNVPHIYSVDNLNSIKQFILEDINEINYYDKENDVLKEFIIKELYEKVNEIPVTNDIGKSIGIGKFQDMLRDICNNAYNILKKDSRFQGIGITIRNIDIYNKKYDNEWGAYHFLMKLGIKSCPYCNRQYISPLYSESGKVRADLDHFYNKATYPFFSISIYNLVPSCKFCNSSLKGTNDFKFETNLNPYEDGFGDRLKFSFEVKSFEDFLGDSDIRIYLQDNIGSSREEQIFVEKAKNNVEAFQIENLYNYHSNEAMGLIKKRVEYSESYIENLIKNYNEKLFRNENEVLEAVLGYQVEDEFLLEKNLTKFTRDICEELGFVFRRGVDKSRNDIDKIISRYKK